MKRNAIGHFELKTSNDFKKNAELLEHAILSTGYSTHSLLLDRPYDKIRNNYHKSCIERPLKKALKSNIKIIRANSSEDIRIFYSIYRLMRKEKGLLPQPLMFFMNMYLLLSKSGLCDVFFASYDGTIVSSVFNIKFKDTYYYEYGATLFRYLGLHPSHFLLDRSIRLAIDEGYNVFNLGRTDKTNIGLSEFKERWGGTKTELKYYSLSNSGPKLPIQKKALPRISRKVIKYAPLPIYDLIGPIIYKAAF
jgi:hypothetical protein